MRIPTAERYETVLPEEARRELKRQPTKKQNDGWKWVAAVAFVIWVIHSMERPPMPPQVPTPSPTATPEPTPTISQPPTPAPVPVPRGELVPVRVVRATLWRLPYQELNVFKFYTIPKEVMGQDYVWARFRGTKQLFSQIPKNPEMGDMWNVTETHATWVYTYPLGAQHAMWIDP